jgi:hypothetical protein
MNPIALHHNPWPENLERPRGLNPLRLYRYAVWYKANPRSADYLRALLAEQFPGVACVSSDQADWRERIAAADEVVLLYPDAIGLSFASVEREIDACKKAWAGVTVLNGRRRRFRLNGGTLLGLRLRRALEWTMLPELLFLAVFVVITPLLWVFDLARGRT